MWRSASNICIVTMLLIPASADALSVTVSNTANSGANSLRQAIFDVNGGGEPTNQITFNIPGPPPHKIELLTAVPKLSAAVTIDGTTQPGYSNGFPAVQISGENRSLSRGIWLQGDTSTVRGLEVFAFTNSTLSSGIKLEGEDCIVQGNVVVSNGIGIDVISANNLIGGLAPSDRNIIVGNELIGVRFIASPGTSTTGNLLQGNYIGVDATGMTTIPNGKGIFLTGSPGNTIGGIQPSACNVVSGNADEGIGISTFSSNTVVLGNYVGVGPDGTTPMGNGDSGVEVNASHVTVGGTQPGSRNVICGNGRHGIQLFSSAAGTRVLGNYIGVDASGVVAAGNIQRGISLHSASDNMIGNGAANGRNIIGGNGKYGIMLDDVLTTGNVIQGNFIGVGADGLTPAPNQSHGIAIDEAVDNTIGGMNFGAGNRIAYNILSGIALFVDLSAIGNRISGNAIYDNGDLGIDLGANGVTTNDPGDVDVGPNQFQNKPVLTNATSGTTTIQGTLHSTSNATFTLEFFASPSCDGSGFGEGSTYLGVGALATDANGDGAFTVVMPISVAAGHYVTATATDTNNNTSEFSACIEVTATDGDMDGIPDQWETDQGLNPAVSNALTADNDGDGFTDLEEYIADTGATNANDFLVITDITVASPPVVSFPSSAERMYRLQSSTNLLDDGAWINAIIDIPGKDGTLSVTNWTGYPNQAYRVWVELP